MLVCLFPKVIQQIEPMLQQDLTYISVFTPSHLWRLFFEDYYDHALMYGLFADVCASKLEVFHLCAVVCKAMII